MKNINRAYLSVRMHKRFADLGGGPWVFIWRAETVIDSFDIMLLSGKHKTKQQNNTFHNFVLYLDNRAQRSFMHFRSYVTLS